MAVVEIAGIRLVAAVAKDQHRVESIKEAVAANLIIKNLIDIDLQFLITFYNLYMFTLNRQVNLFEFKVIADQ